MTTPANLIFRDAMAADVPAIVTLLHDDPLGKKREKVSDPLPQSYWDAFAAITADVRSRLIVIERDRRVVGTMQLTFIPALTHQGAERLLIEAVNVARDLRSQGIGEAMMTWAIDAAKARGCQFVTLFSHKSRRRAHEFYQGLGFKKTHHGFRYEIEK
jgi:ribosomal protein S18 acetylase RimI-like enzyme